MEKDYSELSLGERKILHSLFHSKGGLRFDGLRKKTGLARSSQTELLEELHNKGLITKVGGRFGKYSLTSKGKDTVLKLDAVQVVEEETIRDAERRLSWISWETPYNPPLLWQLFHPLLNQKFSELLVLYLARAYVAAVRTRSPSDPEALKLHVEKTWKIIDDPTEEVLDQVFDWPTAVQETLDELNRGLSAAKGRDLKALQLVRAVFENCSERLYHDIKRHARNPIISHTRKFVENFASSFRPRMYPAFIRPERKYPLMIAAGACIIYSFFLFITGIQFYGAGQLTTFSLISWFFGEIRREALSLYGAIYLAIGIPLPLAAISLLYRQKWGGWLTGSLLITNLLTDLTLGPAIGTSILVLILLATLVKSWSNLS